MNWILRRALGVGALVTIGAGIALLFTKGVRATVVDVYLLVLAGVIMLALFRTARALRASHAESLFEGALAAVRSPDADDTSPLSTERDVELSRIEAIHFHVRMRPLLREVAAHRLRTKYGVELEREPERARELLPADVWEVVRPERPFPEDRLAPGPSFAVQRKLLDGLEKL
jgi:hypothetical protein